MAAVVWAFVCLIFLAGIAATWGFTPTHAFWGLLIAACVISAVMQRRKKLREWFGSVSLFLLLLLSVPGIYGVWRDWGLSADSLLYALLILVITGLVIMLVRLNSVQQDLRALRTDFDTMFGREVEHRRNLPTDRVIYAPGEK